MKPFALVLVSAVLVFSFVAFSSVARADVDAELSVKSFVQGQAHEIKGRFRSKQELLRLDLKGPLPMTTLVDGKARKSWLIFEAARTYTENALSAAGDADLESLASCGADIDGCLASQGFRKSGTGTANGHECTTWEKAAKAADGSSYTQKLWRPAGLKEVAFVKMTSFTGAGPTMEVNLTNLKTAKQDDALFRLPEGYTRAEAAGVGGKPGGKTDAKQLEQLLNQFQHLPSLTDE